MYFHFHFLNNRFICQFLFSYLFHHGKLDRYSLQPMHQWPYYIFIHFIYLYSYFHLYSFRLNDLKTKNSELIRQNSELNTKNRRLTKKVNDLKTTTETITTAQQKLVVLIEDITRLRQEIARKQTKVVHPSHAQYHWGPVCVHN